MFGNWGAIPLHISGENADGSKPFSNIKQHSGPLTFPVYHNNPAKPADPTFPYPDNEKSIYSWFQGIRRITDVTKDHLEALNVTVDMDVPISQLIPVEFIPTEEDTVFAERARELLLENKTAYDVIARIRRDIKLGYMFKFFQSVEMMSPYYDLTPAPAAVPDNSSSSSVAMDIDSGSPAPDSPSNNNNGKRPASPSLSPDPGTPKKPHTDSESSPSPPSASAGASASAMPEEAEGPSKADDKFSVPDRFREDLVRNFIEPLCWNYGVRVYPPRMPPKVHLQRSRFSVHMTTHIHMTAPLPADARAGLVEGPVFGLQVRHEHVFRCVADPSAALKKRRKKLLTLGMGAPRPTPTPQKSFSSSKRRSSRSKEKDAPPPPPPPPAGELLEPDDDDAIDADGILSGFGEDIVGLTRELVALLSLAQHRAREPGSVEKKVRAHAIGKIPGEEWDTVFLVTGMHHHISVSCVRVSKGYLRWLRTGRHRGGAAKGQPRAEQGGDDEWWRLKLMKTRYWSLLIPEERKEAARAVMGVMAWLTREGARVPVEKKTEELKKA